jgi:predicted phage terminase large subunit-like protein
MPAKRKELTSLELAELQLKATHRLLAAKKAHDSLIEFVRLMMPDPTDPDDVQLSRYIVAKHHQVLAAALEEVDKGNMPRLIITLPPRHGKSQIASKAFPAWFMGRDPYRQMIVASYSATMAEDFGREVRAYMQTPAYQQVFPSCSLRKGGAASDRVQTEQGGLGVFVGAGGALTGRGADVLLIDDPVKDREDADSATMREKLWSWFTDVAMTRLMGGMGRVVIIMTRWHEDDLVGRLTDPGNQHYNADEAKQWKIISFPALAEDDDIMGRDKDEPLWPERITKEFLNSQRRLNPRGFSALYQGRPAPEDGDFFKREWMTTYQPNELPRNLRYYCASDHAVSVAQDRDPTVLLPVGVDDQGTIWVLPDVWWRRAQTDDVVDAMLDMMARHKPLIWWAERGHISKSIAPFLRKRMQEESVYCAIDEVVPVKDKQTRAQSIRGRMSMGKVRFPGFAPWWEAARAQMLSFPAGKHDDFVDTIAYIGMGLGRMSAATAPSRKKATAPTGSIGWVKARSKAQARQVANVKAAAGF